MDRLTPDARSANMRAVRRKNTVPEMRVRKLLYTQGYRYRLHVRSLPGSPDIVFPGRKKVIFVHGCFWHQHQGPCERKRKMPRSNRDYWLPKLKRNVLRDVRNLAVLKALGWRVLVVWECETGHREKLVARLKRFLGVVPGP